MTKLNVIGLMSGTSADGIDAALVEISDDHSIFLKAFKTFPFSNKLKQLIWSISQLSFPRKRKSIFPTKMDSRFRGNDSVITDMCRLNVLLGEEFAKAVIRLCQSIQFPLKKVDLIGSHGQTIKHLPQFKSTLQIGEPSVIAERTGVTVVADFRLRDMAAGGEGAPLAPFFHYHLFRSLGYPIAIQNIGGISNVTFIPKDASLNDVIAFDTGPGNMLIDAVVYELTKHKEFFDKDGEMASKGKIHLNLLSNLLSNAYFKKKPPKTTGREMFGSNFAKKIIHRTKSLTKEDVVATMTAFTAHTIAQAYQDVILPKHSLKKMVVGGGGSKNKTLLSMIQKLLPSIQVKRFEDFGFNSHAIEAMAFAFMAFKTIHGNPSNIPSVTGASHAVVLGKIIPGKNFVKSLLKE